MDRRESMSAALGEDIFLGTSAESNGFDLRISSFRGLLVGGDALTSLFVLGLQEQVRCDRVRCLSIEGLCSNKKHPAQTARTSLMQNEFVSDEATSGDCPHNSHLRRSDSRRSSNVYEEAVSHGVQFLAIWGDAKGGE